MNCNYCKGICIKKGYYKNTQRLLCKSCKRYQQTQYSYVLCNKTHEKMIVQLNNEGMSISGISRITGVSKSNVINKIKYLVSKIVKPIIKEQQQEYEVDELYTYIKSKNNPCYIIYALNKNTKQVIDYAVGNRTKENINRIVTKIKN